MATGAGDMTYDEFEVKLEDGSIVQVLAEDSAPPAVGAGLGAAIDNLHGDSDMKGFPWLMVIGIFIAVAAAGVDLNKFTLLAGAFGGATLAGEMSPLFRQIPFLAPYAETISVGLVVVGVLLLVNGFANIVDDARVLTYDITSILAGIGFILVSRLKG